jgi:hypothetical protein
VFEADVWPVWDAIRLASRLDENWLDGLDPSAVVAAWTEVAAPDGIFCPVEAAKVAAPVWTALTRDCTPESTELAVMLAIDTVQPPASATL